MRAHANLLGLIGALLVFFGGVSWLGYGVLKAYSASHLVLGNILLVAWLALSFGDLGKRLAARRTHQGANLVVSSLLVLAFMVLLNVFGVRYEKQIDLTEQGLFSLSPQAARVLAELDAPLQFTAFLEGGAHPGTEALLESFAQGSPLVSVSTLDPDLQPERTEAADVRSYGTVRVSFGSRATNVAAPSEESLTNALIKVTRATEKTLCFVTGEGEPSLDDASSPKGYAEARLALANEHYRTRSLPLLQEADVPSDCQVLVLAAPQRPLGAHIVAAIGAFLDSGGHAMFLLPPRHGDELAMLLADWGVFLGDDVVVDQVIRLFEGPTLGLTPIVETYGAHPITLEMRERTVFPLTRSVRSASPVEGLIATTLASTSQASWAESDLVSVFEKSEAALDEAGGDRAGPISVALAVHADLDSLGRGHGDARLVVFGTAALADNQHLGQVFNRDLFLNAIAWLAGEDDLVAIRPKSLRASRIRFTEKEENTIFYLSVLVLPEFIMILGIAVWWRRSRL
ncbi:MAG: Gldg family protein [Deltaproteobacteria bacterium]